MSINRVLNHPLLERITAQRLEAFTSGTRCTVNPVKCFLFGCCVHLITFIVHITHIVHIMHISCSISGPPYYSVLSSRRSCREYALCMLCCATCTCYLLKRYNSIRYLTINEACARVLNLWKHPEQAEHAQQAHLLRTLLYSRGSNRYGCRWCMLCTLCLLSCATCTRSRSCNRYPLKRRYPFRYLLIKEAEIMQLLPLRAARL